MHTWTVEFFRSIVELNTHFMKFSMKSRINKGSSKHPCGVCRKGVGDNSIRCVECLRWVHKRCSGISGKLKSNVDFHYRRCLEGEHGLFQSVLLKEVVIEPNVKLECVPKFCYLGDTLGAGGGVDEAARARVRCAWLSSRSYCPFWRPVVRRIAWRGRFLGPVSRACWYMGLRHGQWRLTIWQSLERSRAHDSEMDVWGVSEG